MKLIFFFNFNISWNAFQEEKCNERNGKKIVNQYHCTIRFLANLMDRWRKKKLQVEESIPLTITTLSQII